MDDKLIEGLLNQILNELKGVNQRLDRLEFRVGSLEEKVDKLEAMVGSLETRVDSLETRVDSLKEDMKYMKGRQDEMYHMLRGWEENRSLINNNLDKLNIDVLKLKKHTHEIVLTTKEPALKQAQAR